MSGTGSLLDAVQLAETLERARVRGPQVSVLWGTVKHIQQGSREISLLHSSGQSNVPSDVQQAVSLSGMSVRKLSLYTPTGRKAAAGEGGGRPKLRLFFHHQALHRYLAKQSNGSATAFANLAHPSRLKSLT
ncbi:hypothetical protein ACLOJK_018053 [Asimina triloba]